MKALEHRPRSAEIIPFYKPMATSPAPQIPPAPAPSTPNFWQRHGTTAQWGALVVALLAFGINLLSGREVTEKENQKLIINSLIDERLKPVTDQFRELSNQLKELSDQVSFVKGQLAGINTKLKQSALDQKRLTLMVEANDPKQVLADIRVALHKAQQRGQKLPGPTLADYRMKAQTLPSSTTDYWTTVADIINYQSFVNQLESNAPDPSTVAHPCQFVTAGSGSFNVIQGPMLFGVGGPPRKLLTNSLSALINASRIDGRSNVNSPNTTANFKSNSIGLVFPIFQLSRLSLRGRSSFRALLRS